MKNSNLAAATGKKQVPFARKRDHPQFEGIRKLEYSSSSVRTYKSTTSLGDVSQSYLSRSLSDIWEFESKQSSPVDITGAVTMKSEKILEVEEKEEEEQEEERKDNIEIPEVHIPRCAASYYSHNLMQNDASKLCKSMEKLNQYLKSSKDDVEAGVPGRYLRAVITQDVIDLGCFVCAIMYAFYLNETRKDSQVCTVPVINMKRADLSARAEIKWLLKSCCMDESSLIFIDEVQLSYYEQFGNLKLVLVNGNKLPSKQEGLKEAVVEIFYVKEVDSQYPWVEEITKAQDCSSCTLLAEMFVEKIPEILAGQGFSRLLLSSILLDTTNLTGASCTLKDKCMATLLIKGAGRLGCNGLYQILKNKMNDISDLNVRDILRREFKKWTRVSGKPNSTGSRLTISHIGMSCIGISLEDLLAHEDSAVEEILLFLESEKLRLFMIVSGYYDDKKNFKREILVSATTIELMRDFHRFFDINGTHLPLKALDQLGVKEELRAFEIDNQMTSRRTIERLLEEFGGVLRQN